MRKIKTLVLGAAIVDKILEIDKLPKSGDDICASSEVLTVGGCAYNVANILKNFEVEHDLVVPVGSGIYGNLVEKDLLNNGYEVLIRDNRKDNGYCLCLVEVYGERTYITIQGTECEFKKEWLCSLNSKDYKNIYISGYELEGKSGEVICDFLESNNHLNIYFAPGPRISNLDKNILERIYDLYPIIHLNDKEALEYTGLSSVEDAIFDIHSKSNNTVFITLGDKGVLYLNPSIAKYKNRLKESIKLIDGNKVEVVDTIGAGDSHLASIIAAKSIGYSFEDSCKIANEVASKVVSIKGPKIEKHLFNKGEYLKCKM